MANDTRMTRHPQTGTQALPLRATSARCHAAARLAGLMGVTGVIGLTALTACGAPMEPAQVQLPVMADERGIEPVSTDLGYEVALDEARLAIADVTFTVAGEVHSASVVERLGAWLVPTAHAHPGHFQGGDVTGELPGRMLVDWLPGERPSMGDATLLVGTYDAVNFTFERATTDDGLDTGDPLLGHTALLQGTATRDGDAIPFTILIDSPKGRVLVGVPFELEITEDTPGPLGLRLLPQDPYEQDTLFDGVDFAALDRDEDGAVTIAPGGSGDAEAAYNRLRRTFQTHDHFLVVPIAD